MADATTAPATAGASPSHAPNQADGLLKLRREFPAEQISALPKVTCGACSKSPTRDCQKHNKAKCRDCGNYITTAHVDLSYVGHAELTNRLLEADLLWDWEPMAIGPNGLPVFDENGGLWIRLTVCGHTRLGYGDSQGKRGPNAVKEAIGDALRNAAMRFGAALDLWAKSDLRAAQAEHPKSAEEDVPPSREDQREALYEEMKRAWNSLPGLRGVRARIGEGNFAGDEVWGPDGVAVTFGDLVDGRIKELSSAQKAGRNGSAGAQALAATQNTTEGNAA